MKRIVILTAILVLCGLVGLAGATAEVMQYTGTSGGNWSTAANWTGVTDSAHRVPTGGDTVDLYGKTVVIDTGINAATIPQDWSTNGVPLAGFGTSVAAGNATLSLSSFSGTVYIYTSALNMGSVATGKILNVSGGTNNLQIGNSSNTCSFVGGGASGGYGLYFGATSTCTIYGSISSGSSGNGNAPVFNYTSGTITFYGGSIAACTGGTATHGINNSSSGGVLNIYGSAATITGGGVANAFGVNNAGTLNIGQPVGTGAGWITSITGGSNTSGYGIYTSGSVTTTVYATTITGATAPGISTAGSTLNTTCTTLSGGNSGTAASGIQGSGIMAINAATVEGGSGTSGCYGLSIQPGSTATQSVTATTIEGGTAGSSQHGIYNAATGNTINVTATNINGTAYGMGINNGAAGSTINILQGTITGGGAAGCNGLSSTSTSSTVNFSNVNLVWGTECGPYVGVPPTWQTNYPLASNHMTINGQTFGLQPSAGNLLHNVQCGTVTGSYTDPGVANVLSTVSYGAGGTSETGTFVDPGANNVLSTALYGTSGYGNYYPPTQSKVLSIGTYGVGDGTSGTFIDPGASNVLSTANYGASGGKGTYADPGVGNVLSTVSYGAGGNGETGTYKDPGPSNVKSGVSYGAGGNGETGTYSLPAGGGMF